LTSVKILTIVKIILDDCQVFGIHGRKKLCNWEKELAARIVRGELVTSLTRRALFYHQVDIQPAWASEMVRTAKIGNHIFYRPPSHATQARLTGQPTRAALNKPRSA